MDGEITGFLFFLDILIVTIMVVFGIPKIKQIIKSSNWTEIPCTIKASNSTLIEHPGTRKGSLKEYEINIEYSYNVNLKEYTSTRYTLETNKVIVHNDVAIRFIMERYQPGEETVCYVNLKNPEESMLIKEINDTAIFLFFITLFIFTAPLIYFIYYFLFAK